MGKQEDLITKYAQDLKDKCGVNPDLDLLTKVTVGLGPSIYNKDSETVATNDETEVERVRQNFLIKKLGLSEGKALDDGIAKVAEQYGKSNKNKYRAVFYYLLTKHFNKESAY